ncbi:hypothetical protein CGRA01v4_04649 [Colletotrichum graminicola]|nr:hypothetical protein CGRA01v4_04649 [Colletotrichum graminicola]
MWHHLVSIDTSPRFSWNQGAMPWEIGTAWIALRLMQRLVVSLMIDLGFAQKSLIARIKLPPVESFARDPMCS